MTLQEIEERLHEAITTLAALPDRERRFLKAKMASWPETLREAADIWEQGIARVRQGKAAFEAMRAPRSVPSPDAIDRMDEALPWLNYLDVDDQRIVMLRGHGVHWSKIAARVGTTEYFIKKWYNAALATIQAKLEHEQQGSHSAA